jgi:two-component system, LytTR family, sensor kinase
MTAAIDMKRVRLHIIFWGAYIIQYAFLEVVSMQQFLSGTQVGKQLAMGIESTLVILPTKLLAAYFAMYVFQKSVLSEKRPIVLPLLGMAFILVVSVVLFRAAYYYFIDPFIYQSNGNQPGLFDFMYVWVGTLEILSVVGIAVIIKFVRMEMQSREKKRLLLQEKLETELKFLRNQTNPHFLFNTLNNIYALALKKSDDTPGVVKKLLQLLKFMQYESGKTTIPVGDEMKILDDYIDLERIRYHGRLQFDFVREIDDEKARVAPLLLLSFVENAFKHGPGESRFASYIHINVKLQSGLLHFTIENAREPADKPAPNGTIGLANVRRQIELLYTDYCLQVEEEKKSFKVNLVINLYSHAKI